MGRGALISFEGLDRSGKSTQVRMLKHALQEAGHRVLDLKFPCRSSTTGHFIDRHLRGIETVPDDQLQTLFVENRREAAGLIADEINSGTTVLLDRYSHSGIAYGAAKRMDPSGCAEREAGLPRPDVVVLVDVPPAVALTRAGYGEEIYESVGFQSRVREEFFKLRDDTWRVVDGGEPAESVHYKVLEHAASAIRCAAEGGAPLSSF